MSEKNYKRSDTFFYYNEIDPKEIAKADLMQIVLQEKRKLFYSRDTGADIQSLENNPNTFSTQITARFSIAEEVAKYNQNVSNGEDGTVDRRLAVSQNSVSIDQKEGNLNIDVRYFRYEDFEEQNQNIRV